MERPNDFNAEYCRIVPVRVLACLVRDWLTVIVCPNIGLLDGGITILIPMALVPLDLRMPNSEFDLAYVPQSCVYTHIIRR